MKHKSYSSKTKIYWTCRALLLGRTITHKDEIGEVFGWRLGAIIHTLRTEYQWPIKSQKNSSDGIAYYSLPDACNPDELKFPRSALALQTELYEVSENSDLGTHASTNPCHNE